MRIPWSDIGYNPLPGDTVLADFLSIDHDRNPGGLYDDPATVFSKVSWDRDGSVDTAEKSIHLVLGGTNIVPSR